MRTVIFDASACFDRHELHSALKNALDLPEWYGNNLDALHDCLTDIHEDTVLYLLSAGSMSDKLGDYADKLLRVLRDSSAENSHFSVELI